MPTISWPTPTTLLCYHFSIQAPVGRTLDFLLQELFRETNTIGNKANFLAISQIIVGMKTELEKMREQAQNIE